jgi:hypothetical protein
MSRCIMLVAAVALAGCTGTASLGQNPGYIRCEGKQVLAIVGGASAFSGINGSVTADCGTGAIIEWGGTPPAASVVAAP